MRINYLIASGLCFCACLIAQNSSTQIRFPNTASDVHKSANLQAPPEDRLTLYEIGEPITSCESNFRNLFLNVPDYVNHDFELKSCERLATLETPDDIRKYKELFLNASTPSDLYKNTPFGNFQPETDMLVLKDSTVESVSVAEDGTETRIVLNPGHKVKVVERKTNICFSGWTTLNEFLKDTKQNKAEMEMLISQIDNAFQIKHIVYKVNYGRGGAEDVMYAVCHPETHQVIVSNIFSGVMVLRNVAKSEK